MMQESLALRLRVLRAERRLTLRDVEAATGVAKETLSEIERGRRRRPKDVTLAKLADFYGVALEDLLQLEPEEPTAHLAEEELLSRPEVQEWLTEQDHMSEEEFLDWARDLDPEIDEDGIPQGIENAIEELRNVRERIVEDLDKPSVRNTLFPRRQGLPFQKERIREALKPAKLAWRLKVELRREYLIRETTLSNYSRRLSIEGKNRAGRRVLEESYAAAVAAG